MSNPNPNPLKRDEVPKDNSHFPITIKPGERFAWWKIGQWTERRRQARDPDSSGPVLSRTPKNLLEPITHEGHTPTLTVHDINNDSAPYFSLRCSCGKESNYDPSRPRYTNARLTEGGKFPKNFIPRWNSHIESLAAPVKICEAKAARATYTYWVSSQKDLAQLDVGRKSGPRPGPYQHESYKEYFFIVRQSTHSKPKILNCRYSVNEAINLAQTYAMDEKMEGRTLTWFEEPAVAEPSGDAATILHTMESASGIGAMRNVVKLADEYLAYTEIIKAKRDELVNKINDELEMK